MIRAVIFDLYGVLGLNGWQDFKRRYFSEDPTEWQRLRSLGQAVDAKEASYDELVAEISLSTGAPESEVRHSLEVTKPNTPLLEYIHTSLKNYKIGVLSNANKDVMAGIFSAAQMALFDDVVLSVHTGLTKPDEALFLLACERLGVEPYECICIDDKKTNVEAARRAGMKGIVYKDVARLAEAIQREL